MWLSQPKNTWLIISIVTLYLTKMWRLMKLLVIVDCRHFWFGQSIMNTTGKRYENQNYRQNIIGFWLSWLPLWDMLQSIILGKENCNWTRNRGWIQKKTFCTDGYKCEKFPKTFEFYWRIYERWNWKFALEEIWVS